MTEEFKLVFENVLAGKPNMECKLQLIIIYLRSSTHSLEMEKRKLFATTIAALPPSFRELI